ncbi:MAG: sigma-54 dependent transcriptional regulator [Dysgonamonadaceae bacterium]
MSVKILIIEDDFSFSEILKQWSKRTGYLVSIANSVKMAKEFIRKKNNDFDLILTDLRLPDGDGIVFLSWLRETGSLIPVIVMTGYAEIATAVSAMKLGAFDYLPKPIQPDILKQKIDQAIQQKPLLQEQHKAQQQETVASHQVVYAQSVPMKKMYEEIDLVAPTNLSVLIIGESGTGKEYAARMLHAQSSRKSAPFIAVDCGILSRELAPSELFGHLKGSFTSAEADKKGVFEQANGGTVFLDEIENLSPDVQTQLLRALQERKVRPVGASNDIPVDVRIVSATNENLDKMIAEGRFREDLYHRINEFSIRIPALRDRKEDISLYAQRFLEEANVELSQQAKGFSEEAMELLMGYSWSGNLRELRNVVRRAVLFAKNGKVTPQILPEYLTERIIEPQLVLHSEDEKEQIITILRIVKGNKAAAARLLKISRKTLYNKMHEYGLEL